MTGSNENQVEREGPTVDDQEPQVYSVAKDLTGWKFSRRGFLAAAATATAGVAAATAATATSDTQEAPPGEAELLEDWISLEVATAAMRFVEPGQSFTQVWMFTNNSDTTWCKGVSLHLGNADLIQAPASIPVPDIAPGETVDVQVEMAAPTTPGTYKGSWTLRSTNNIAPVSYGPFVIQSTCIVESSHPYASNLSQTWTVSNPDADAHSTWVHFTRADLEPGYDHIILKDESGQERQRITGDHPSGLWSNPIPGRGVQVQLVTDATDTRWGFCLDQVETAHLVHLPVIIRESAGPPPSQPPTATDTPIPTKTTTVEPSPTATTTTTTTPTCLAESPHPYSNNMDETWEVTNPDPGAEGSRVHFSRLEVERNFDYVYIKDSTGQSYQRITGYYLSGLWSEPVPGRVVRVQLDTDGSITKWGFCIDQVETTGQPPTPTPTNTPTSTRTATPTRTPTPTGTRPTSTPTPTRTPCPSHCSHCSHCSHTHYWYPN